MFESYPASLKIDYPDKPLNKLTTFFRLFMLVPVAILIALLVGASYQTRPDGNAGFIVGGAGFVILPLILMLLFRRKYPEWWFSWNLNLTKFAFRVRTYACLMTDIYPSTDEEQTVHINIPYPDAVNDLNRWLPLVKWFLAIPHYIVLLLLSIAMLVAVIIAWFAILFTGNYPRGLFDFIEGVLRWGLRVLAYSVLLTTDKYPPFSLND